MLILRTERGGSDRLRLDRDRRRAFPRRNLEPMLPRPADRSNRPARARSQSRYGRLRRHDRDALVDCENISSLMKLCPYRDPDVFVLDIDGIDYYVMKRVLELDFRPKVIVVEYNNSFGPDRAVTVPYKQGFSRWKEHPTGLFFGVSIAAWRALLGQYRYSFITVETSGTNALFLDQTAFSDEFISAIHGTSFLDNIGDLSGATRPYKDASGDLVLPLRDWKRQLEQLADANFVEISAPKVAETAS
jgi:hypothetical protein